MTKKYIKYFIKNLIMNTKDLSAIKQVIISERYL